MSSKVEHIDRVVEILDLMQHRKLTLKERQPLQTLANGIRKTKRPSSAARMHYSDNQAVNDLSALANGTEISSAVSYSELRAYLARRRGMEVVAAAIPAYKKKRKCRDTRPSARARTALSARF